MTVFITVQRCRASLLFFCSAVCSSLLFVRAALQSYYFSVFRPIHKRFNPVSDCFMLSKNFGGQDCVCSSPSLKSSWLCFHGFFRLNVPQIYNFFATRLLKPFSYLKSFSAFNKLLHKERLPPSFREKDGLRKPPVPQKGGVKPTEGISEQGFPPLGGERGLGNGFGGGKGKKKWATRRRPPIFLIKIKYNPYLPNEKDNTSMLLCQALDCHRLTVRETIFPSSASQVTM